MVVGICRIELFLPESQSLKDKRRILKSLSSRISHRFNVSVCEVEHHELWQRGTIAIAHVARSKGDAEKLLNHAVAYSERVSRGEIVRHQTTFHNPEKDQG